MRLYTGKLSVWLVPRLELKERDFAVRMTIETYACAYVIFLPYVRIVAYGILYNASNFD